MALKSMVDASKLAWTPSLIKCVKRRCSLSCLALLLAPEEELQSVASISNVLILLCCQSFWFLWAVICNVLRLALNFFALSIVLASLGCQRVNFEFVMFCASHGIPLGCQPRQQRRLSVDCLGEAFQEHGCGAHRQVLGRFD